MNVQLGVIIVLVFLGGCTFTEEVYDGALEEEREAKRLAALEESFYTFGSGEDCFVQEVINDSYFLHGYHTSYYGSSISVFSNAIDVITCDEQDILFRMYESSHPGGFNILVEMYGLEGINLTSRGNYFSNGVYHMWPSGLSTIVTNDTKNLDALLTEYPPTLVPYDEEVQILGVALLNTNTGRKYSGKPHIVAVDSLPESNTYLVEVEILATDKTPLSSCSIYHRYGGRVECFANIPPPNDPTQPIYVDVTIGNVTKQFQEYVWGVYG